MNDLFRKLWNFFLLPVIQIVILSIVQVIGFMVAAQLAGIIVKSASPQHDSTQSETQPSVEATGENESRPDAVNDGANSATDKQLRIFGFLVLACLLNSMAMVCWLRQTRLTGFGLMAAGFVAFFMCMTVMPQSETLMFLGGDGTIVRSAAIMGFVVSMFFAFAAGLLLWRSQKRKAVNTKEPTYSWSGISKPGLIARLTVSAILYVVLYVVFGYFVAWQNPELRALYGGGEQVLGFWERVTSPPTSNRVIPFQFLRGIVWTFLCLGMIRVSSGNRILVAVSIGLVIAIVMNSQLLLPNPFMSENVRMIHLIETATSNFLFGLVCVWLWTTTGFKLDSR